MKKVLLAIMVMCLGLAGSVSAAVPLVNDLAGYWPLDGDGSDASVYGNDGAIMGDLIIGNVADANAMVGQALGFSGANYVEIPNASQYDITDHISMSLWFRVDNFNTDWQTAFSRGDWSWRLARHGSTDAMASHFDVPAGDRGDWGVTNINDGAWHHICGTMEAGAFTMYIDGVIDPGDRDQDAEAVIPINTNGDDPVCIAAQIHNGSDPRRHWIGHLDEVAIWDRTLTADDVNTLYNAGAPTAIVDWRAGGPISPANDLDSTPRIVVVPDVTVSWVAGAGASPAVSSYSVYGGTDPDALSLIGNVPAAQTSASMAGLTQDAIYYWRVDSHNSTNLNDSNFIATGAVWAFNADMRPLIITQPQIQSVMIGETAQFTVVSANADSYQWFDAADVALVDAGDISGAQTDMLSIANTEEADEVEYYCVLTNTNGVTETDHVALSLKQMIGYWPLDGDGTDISGNANHGVKVGSATEAYVDGVPGLGGQAADMGGDWALGIPNREHFDQMDTGPYTVSCWIKTGGMNNWRPFVSKRGEGGEGWQLRKSGDNDSLIMTNRGTSGDADMRPAQSEYPAILDNEWHFVAGTWDGQTTTAYVDGAAWRSIPNTGTISPTFAAVCIGARFNGGNEADEFNDLRDFYNGGLIDEVKIANWAMTEEEIATEYLDITGEAACAWPPMIGDISGPEGVPDCIVDFYDVSVVGANWARCLLAPLSQCP